jgi:copper chaperone
MHQELIIQNLKCGGCATTIRLGLEEIKGVTNVKVDEEKDLVAFDCENQSEFEAVKEKLNHLGYPPAGTENTFGKKVKSYASCVVGRMKN